MSGLVNQASLNSIGLNQARLTGTVVQLSVLRYTPAGVAVMNIELDHHSQVLQASSERAIMFTIDATALGEVALKVAELDLGKQYTFDGFWAPAHHRTKRMGFHILQVR